jgi:hypothetical protein
VEVDIPVTTSSDAPVVATVADTDGSGSNNCVFRHFNGGFFRSTNDVLTIDDIVSGKIASRHLGYLGQRPSRADELIGQWNAALGVKAGVVIGGENVRDWGRDSIEEFKTTVENSVRGFLAIDGTIWQRCPEPRLAVETTYSNPRPSVVVTPIDDERRWNNASAKPRSPYEATYFHNPLWQSFFRLDDLEKAEDWLRSRGVVFTTPFAIDVADASVFKFDRAEDIVHRIAAAFLKGVVPELISQSDRFVDAWKSVRRQASAILDDEAQQAIVSLVSEVAEYIDFEPLRKNLVAATEDWAIDAALARPLSPRVGGSTPWSYTADG